VLSTIKHFPEEYHARISGNASSNGRGAGRPARVQAKSS